MQDIVTISWGKRKQSDDCNSRTNEQHDKEFLEDGTLRACWYDSHSMSRNWRRWWLCLVLSKINGRTNHAMQKLSTKGHLVIRDWTWFSRYLMDDTSFSFLVWPLSNLNKGEISALILTKWRISIRAVITSCSRHTGKLPVCKTCERLASRNVVIMMMARWWWSSHLVTAGQS